MAAVLTEDQVKQQRTLFLWLLPVYALVPTGFWLAFARAGIEMSWAGFGLGALGWWVALLLRAPLAIALQKARVREALAKTLVVGFSGPAEELVRWGLIALTAATVPWAAAIGQGWAAIEVVYAVVQGFVLITLAGRQDQQAQEARAYLAATGYGELNPVVGVLERITASSIHIGFTLLIAKHIWLVPVLVLLHSAVNLAVTKLMGAPWKQQAVVAIVGFTALIAALFA